MVMKILHIFILMVVGFCLTVSCDSDRDSNPTIQIPESFVLNTPPYSANGVDLSTSQIFELTTTQPDYGYTAPVIYSIQVSLDDTWVDATEEMEASYYTLPTTFTTAKLNVVASEMAGGIVTLSGWTNENQVPTDEIPVYVRLRAHLGANLYPVYSNVIELSVLPYFVLLKDADPAFYYLIGNYVGGWDPGINNIGTSTIPMGVLEDYNYDKVTGVGSFRYTGYFEAATPNNGFKLIGTIAGEMTWNEQWGNGEDNDMPGIDNLVHLSNEGGNPGHLGLPEAGWWQIDVDGKEGTLEFTKLDAEPHAAYTTMEIMGSFNEWSDPLVMQNIGSSTHDWYLKYEFTSDVEVKFRADSNWDIAWGGTRFPYGVSDSGDNLKVEAGTYIIVFNDIDKSYGFFKL